MKIKAVSNFSLLVYMIFFSCCEKKQLSIEKRVEETFDIENYRKYSYLIEEQQKLFSLNGLLVDEPESRALEIFGKPDSITAFRNPLSGEILSYGFNSTTFKNTHVLNYKETQIWIFKHKVHEVFTRNKDFCLNKLDIKIEDYYYEIKQKFPDFIWSPYPFYQRYYYEMDNEIFKNKEFRLSYNTYVGFSQEGGLVFEFKENKLFEIQIWGKSY